MINDYGIGEREIKFRAWDSAAGQFINESDTVYRKGALWDSAGIGIGKDNGMFLMMSDEEDVCMPFPDIKLMQYTGLKDKNGKEIYEGDIIKFTYPTNVERKEGAGVVRWYSSGWLAENKERSWSIDYEGSLNISMEVIGNIFENEELLK